MNISRDSSHFPYSPFRGLYDRQGDEIIDAAAEDTKLAMSYPDFQGKGPVKDGTRLTIMVQNRVFAKGETIHILHFVEITRPGAELYIMGPKQVYGLYIDDHLMGEQAPDSQYPWVGIYDGAVLPSPELDYNFEIGKYAMDVIGEHNIQWRIDGFVSNTVVVTIK